MAAVRCTLCDRLLMVARLPVADEAPAICDVCAALPAPERKRRRDQIMVRMLWDDVFALQSRRA